MDEASKERLRKKEILTYSRRNKAPMAPPPASKIVPPPPPPLVHDFLPQPTPTIEDLHLNIDVTNMMGNMNMVVPLAEMCKIPSVRKEVLKALKIQDEVGDPLVILNTMYHGNIGRRQPPFLSLSRHKWSSFEQLYVGLWGLNQCDSIEGHETVGFADNPSLWKCLWHRFKESKSLWSHRRPEGLFACVPSH
jgi:hypothetical protein